MSNFPHVGLARAPPRHQESGPSTFPAGFAQPAAHQRTRQSMFADRIFRSSNRASPCATTVYKIYLDSKYLSVVLFNMLFPRPAHRALRFIASNSFSSYHFRTLCTLLSTRMSRNPFIFNRLRTVAKSTAGVGASTFSTTRLQPPTYFSLSPLFAAFPSIFVLSPLSTAFAHSDVGVPSGFQRYRSSHSFPSVAEGPVPRFISGQGLRTSQRQPSADRTKK